MLPTARRWISEANTLQFHNNSHDSIQGYNNVESQFLLGHVLLIFS